MLEHIQNALKLEMGLTAADLSLSNRKQFKHVKGSKKTQNIRMGLALLAYPKVD
eukprot:CAMPEP_0202943120 /NCGR_PEP_ID=MMETSP1395-20130829/3440_1 /ASSEMBLY_ACC=CAM_ASM_000871 /TAXON_ID=5961 /ORGANISM="Blepharisma japonicum, Strain Stock R1072" /LENGTH=53 /DNA_ID=CAMNT_0049640159 /DNA_START=530 /DNA_END=691 /DNA_ORIENTATION=-